MQKVYEKTIDVTDAHNLKGNRWIKFNEGGSFESLADPYGENTGKGDVLTGKSILMIYSKEENDDSEWHLTINCDNMTWKGVDTPRKEGFEFIYKKIAY